MTFVVQRYGIEVNGGAEVECRAIAELMSDVWDVEVLTTCALDYMTWSNYYSEGADSINGVRVRRFPVRQSRNIAAFNKLSETIFSRPHLYEDELLWMKMQGPDSPALLKYIKEHKENADAFIFVTYLYATTFWGLTLVADKAFLIPTSHDEPPIYLSIFEEFFKKPKGFIFNTPEEKEFLINRFSVDCRHSDIIGVGIKEDCTISNKQETQLNLPNAYVVYVGRVDASKGCQTLFEYWDAYKRNNPSPLTLVLVGGSQMDIPLREDIIPLGFIDENDKWTAIANAKCLINPSPYESFSIVLLESWVSGTPVLVNGQCNVLKGQCRRSNGGLWYNDYNEFAACLDFILDNESIAKQMTTNGKNYADRNYDWDLLKRKYATLIQGVVSARP